MKAKRRIKLIKVIAHAVHGKELPAGFTDQERDCVWIIKTGDRRVFTISVGFTRREFVDQMSPTFRDAVVLSDDEIEHAARDFDEFIIRREPLGDPPLPGVRLH